jgi:hypothetical protein
VDYNSAQVCSNIQARQDAFVPHNKESLLNSSFHQKETMQQLTLNLDKKMQIKDKGVGEYSLCLSKLPISPKSHGQPTLSTQKVASASTSGPSEPITKFDGLFIKVNTSAEEVEDRDVLNWLYKDDEASTSTTENANIPIDQYGKGATILGKMGYEGKGPLDKHKQSIVEPI